VVVHCVDCHLPPKGDNHLAAKIKHGAKDIYGELFKDAEKINWEEKSKLENAIHFTYMSSCIGCHENLFPSTLSKEGDEAHLYYIQQEEKVTCLNCHLAVGHYNENAIHAKNVDFGLTPEEEAVLYTEPAAVERFTDFTEYIPETGVSFEMIAIPGGTFKIGSPESEELREADEGPIHAVEVSDFWMGKIEVTWNEYLAFFNATASEGRKSLEELQRDAGVDAITGATPPWGAPDQGWGKGERPAITMSHFAAETYCQWLTKVTGKKYRLPTEAEWEYACRAGTESPYFFEGNPKDYSSFGFMKKIFKPDTSGINSYAIYSLNSGGKTHEPAGIKPNPFGLVNMTGNVSEFCQDWYAEDAYAAYAGDIIVDPTGPVAGTEHVVRGGSFRSDAADLRSSARDQTKTDAWLVTDPQIPKSIWWYSDCIHVGFRVVCEVGSVLNE
jgi:formylglycine-generating enzyme required for sulfatase activity